jgi:TM2 domain-containing membrane protein YozV
MNPGEANVCFNCGTALAPLSPWTESPTVPQKPFQQPSYPAPPSPYPASYPNPPQPYPQAYPPSVAPQPAPYQQPYPPPYPPPVAPPSYSYNQYQQQALVAPQPYPIYQVEPKSRVVFILLAIFLGAFGVHNFYAGYVGRGIAQLLLTFFTCGYGAILVFIWSIIEIIAVDRDTNGVPMT